MNRTTARMALTMAGAGALTGLAAGAAHADTPSEESGTAPAPAAGQEASPVNQVWLLRDAPAVPIEDPTFGVFDVAAPVYGVVGSFS